MTQLRVRFPLVLALLCLVLAAAGPSAAVQSTAGENTSTETATDSPAGSSNDSGRAGTANGTNITASAAPSAPTTPGSRAGSMRGAEPKSGVCENLGVVQTMTCNGAVGTLQGIGDGIVDLYGDVMEGVIYFIVNRPRAMDGGDPSIAGRPTNEPMTSVYDIWLNKGLAAGVAVWGFFMLFNQFRSVFPTGATSSYARDEMARRGWFILGFMLASWPLSMALLHLAHGLSAFIAPGSEAISADLQTASGTSAAAVIGSLALYFTSGVVALLAAIEFILAYVGVFVLTPYLPLAMALSTPDFWIFDRVASIGETIVSLYVPTVFFTLPTAMVLGVGYPLANTLATSIPDAFAFIPGLGTGTTAVLGVLLLAVWVLALLAPVFVFAGASQLRLFSGMLAGATGALAISQLRNRDGSSASVGETASTETRAANTHSSTVASGTATTQLGPGTSPIQGSPAAPDTAGTGFLEPRGVSEDTTSSSTLVSSQPNQTGTTGQAHKSDTSSGIGTSTAGAQRETAGSSDTESGPTVIHDRSGFDGEQNYFVGYLDRDGDFQTIYREGRNGKWLVDQDAYNRLAERFDDKELLLQNKETEELYDVRQIIGESWQRQGGSDDVTTQNRVSRDIVYDTWGQ